MQKEEALKQIELITKTMNADNQILLSPPMLVIIGILLCLMPVIEFTTDGLTFGISMMTTSTVIIIHWVVYIILFGGISKAAHHYLKLKSNSSNNPILKKVFKIKLPLLVSIFGTALIFSITGNGTLVFPVIMILLGLLYNLFGQFSIKIVRIFSWTYILAGFLMVYLSQFNLSLLVPMLFVIYLGASYIVMGLVILNYKNKRI
jgi:hypothetical protein